jgi:nucleotidyltransferase/DNA polymerase involved in DNA repair
MSVLYCTIPHFATALMRRDRPDAATGPIVLLGPDGRVVDACAEATACAVREGMTARAAEVRCPGAHLLEVDLDRCRSEMEALFQVLEQSSVGVEPRGLGEAYADLADLAREPADAATLLREVGHRVRRELGQALQPALGWDKSKFTAEAAARRTQPGRLLTIGEAQERPFLNPLPVMLLPLAEDSQQRLRFLGLLTLGQYAALPRAAVWQQFGPAGKLAHRCARGEDDRPVIPRGQVRRLHAAIEFECPLVERQGLVAALSAMAAPLLAELQGALQACGQVRLAVHFEGGSRQERERTFMVPVAYEERLLLALGQLLDGMRWQAGAAGLAISLEQIQDAAVEQRTLFPQEEERKGKLREVEQYLVARFGANRLRRAVIAQPGAPLPEWRVTWQP